MPPVQARAYAEFVAQAKNEEGLPMLEVLHGLRGISLHPLAPSASTNGHAEEYIASSARTAELFSDFLRHF